MLNGGFAFAFNENIAIDLGVLSHHFDNDDGIRTRYITGVSVGSFSGYVFQNVDNDDNLQSCVAISILKWNTSTSVWLS